MTNLFDYLFQDWSANKNRWKIRLSLCLFRLAQKVYKLPKILTPFIFIYLFFYEVLVQWIFCLELHWKTNIGPALHIYHGYATVVHRDTVIGANCTIRQCTTLGTKSLGNSPKDGAPVIGDNVDIGANVLVLGPVKIGSGAIIGAGSVVLHDVPPGAVVVGNPARIIKSTEKIEG